MRTTDAAMDAVIAGNGSTVTLLEFDLTSGTQRYCTWSYDLAYGGHTYVGAAKVAQIDEVRDVSAPQIVGRRFTLSGLDESTISLVLSERVHLRPWRMYTAVLTAGYQITGTPVLEDAGVLDTLRIRFSADRKMLIEVTAETLLSMPPKALGARYTDAEQRRISSGDTGYSRVVVGQREGVWPNRYWRPS